MSKSLRKTAHDMNIPMLVFEGGESLRMDEFSVQEGLRGLIRVLKARKMISGRNKKVNPVELNSGTWIRASRSGMFNCHKYSGEHVSKGEVLGTISGPYGNFEVKIKAKKDGFIYGHNNQPVLNQGDALFHIGYP